MNQVQTTSSLASDHNEKESLKSTSSSEPKSNSELVKETLPKRWRLAMIILTCFCSFGNHWSNFATLVAVTNLVNTFLCVAIGFAIDKWGGARLSVVLASFHLAGSLVMAGAATNGLNSYTVLIVGKVLAAIGDGSLDNAQHRIFATYFGRGKGFAFSIGAIWSIANLGQFTGQSTANVISVNLGSYAWALWISAVVALFSVICAFTVVGLDKYLRQKYVITDQTDGKQHVTNTKRHIFNVQALRNLPMTFWLVVLFSIFENAGVQSFVSISTQFAQQRLKKGAVVGGWVSSMYLLVPIILTPFLGIFIDIYGHRASMLLCSGIFFLISMLFLKFARSVPTFVVAYIFYALAQAVTPAPQVEIIRSIIPDGRFFGTAFAIKKSVVQGSIVIITTAAGKIQDNAGGSLDPAITLWLTYAFISVVVSGFLLFASIYMTGLLPAARLAQVRPRDLMKEVRRLEASRSFDSKESRSGEGKVSVENQLSREKDLKKPTTGMVVAWSMLGLSAGVILLGWVLFGLGVAWGVHGSVIAGTTGE